MIIAGNLNEEKRKGKPSEIQEWFDYDHFFA